MAKHLSEYSAEELVYSHQSCTRTLAKGGPYASRAENRVREIEGIWAEQMINPKLEKFISTDSTKGMLACMGYRVGQSSGVPKQHRHAILDRIIVAVGLPLVWKEDYTREWGKPGSPERKHKLVRALATFVDNASKRLDGMEKAIAEWQDDLTYIEKTY